MHKPKPTFFLVSLSMVLVTMAAVGGCSTSRPGVTDTLGTLKTTLPAMPSDVVEAARQAVDDLGLLLVHTSHDYQANSAELVVRARTGQRVSIDVTPVGKASVQVAVRYGVAGDEELSQTILDHIRKHLWPTHDQGASPSAAPPSNP